jgi:hypothetical protein
MKQKLLEAGVKNLREFGYPSCTAENILTDYVYASFFMRMLEDNRGHSATIDKAIDELITECKKATTPVGGNALKHDTSIRVKVDRKGKKGKKGNK